MSAARVKFKIFLTFISLALLFLTGILIRLSYYHATFSGFVPYAAESASHYYYAKRIHSGAGVPYLDKTIQRPEGLKVFQKTSIFMEYAVVWLYNTAFSKLTGWDFHAFTRFTMPFFYMFSIFAVFIAAWALTQNLTPSFTACALLVFSRGAIERSTGFEFLSENFSLPFIFLHFSLVTAASRHAQKSSLLFFLSGIALSISLCSWKITQFYLAVFCVFLALWFLFSSDMQTPQKCARFTLLFCILSGFAAPYLREGKFLITPPLLLLYFLCFSPLASAHLSGKSNRILFLLSFSCLAVVIYHTLLPSHFRTAMYSHVYGMLYYKIKFLLQKPADAALLPPDVRAFWVPPFLSPTFKEMLNAFPVLIPLSVAGCAYHLRQAARGKISREALLLVFFTLVFILFYIFFSRMRAFLAFFLCLSSAFFLHQITGSRKRLLAALCMLILGIEAAHSLRMSQSPLTRYLSGNDRALAPVKIIAYHENKLLDAVRKHTRPGDVILTRWALSPTLHAYEQRNIVLHAFFESPDIREKNQMFNESLFAGVEALHKKCKTWNATILILARNMTDENFVSERYMANVKTLRPSMAVVKLLGDRQDGRYFKMLYDGEMFRMFRVIP